MEMAVAQTIVCSFIVFMAFFTRSLTGFGGALICVPLLALLFDLKFVIPAEAVMEVVLSALLLRSVYRQISWKELIPVVFGAAVGTLLGVYFLHSFANQLLKKSLGVVVVFFGLLMLFSRQKDTKPLHSAFGSIAGLIGGALGGMLGTSGPVFVTYLTYQLHEKTVLRATLIGLFSFDFGWRVATFAVTGLLTEEVGQILLYSGPGLILGTLLGSIVQKRISSRRFGQVTLLIILISGLALLLF
jgi:uncharacterized membrane protein YfcA